VIDPAHKLPGVLGAGASAGLVLYQVVRLARGLWGGAADFSLARRPVLKPSGKWEGAPVAEIDKSTTGRLLAGRVRRDPSLLRNVSLTPSPPEPGSTPPRRDGLWDRDLDG